MSEPNFFQTRIGRQFYEATMPELVKQLKRIAERLPTNDSNGAARVNELLLATYGLVNAVTDVLDTEITPGSGATQRAFRNLRIRAKSARQAADAIR